MITVHGKGSSLAELRAITPTTPAAAGRRWKAIPHGELVDTIKNEIMIRRWRVTKELYATTRNGADMAGSLLLEGVPGITPPPGLALAVGITNSNARRKALQIIVGAEITCCANGFCTGNILLNRVHDHTVNLVEEIKIAINMYERYAQCIPAIIQSLRDRVLTRAEASDILMEAGRHRLVGWTTLVRVDQEYAHPHFTEHGTGTAWALLNAFTFIARNNIATTRQMEVYDAFRRMLPTANKNN